MLAVNLTTPLSFDRFVPGTRAVYILDCMWTEWKPRTNGYFRSWFHLMGYQDFHKIFLRNKNVKRTVNVATKTHLFCYFTATFHYFVTDGSLNNTRMTIQLPSIKIYSEIYYLLNLLLWFYRSPIELGAGFRIYPSTWAVVHSTAHSPDIFFWSHLPGDAEDGRWTLQCCCTENLRRSGIHAMESQDLHNLWLSSIKTENIWF